MGAAKQQELDAVSAMLLDLAAAHNATPEQWASLEWRLENLYWIVDKLGEKRRFVMNKQQRQFLSRMWWRNLILKARQLGFSTLIALIQLDQAIWYPNFNGVIISQTLPDAGKLFGKVEFAYNSLAALLREVYPVDDFNKGSKLTIRHRNADGTPANSTVSVGVSSRGGTVQLLHISELGKISLKFPQRADEIKTGALPSAELGCTIIESTAEGAFGLYWELCEPAIKRWHDGSPETRKDYRLHFFPWFEADEYRMSDEDTAIVSIAPELTTYFNKIQAELGVVIDQNQRAWYCKEKEIQGKKMKQEYPSTPEEAFEQAIDGAVYGEEMTWLREQGRIGVCPLDPNFPVNTFWDFGTRDATAIWFHQYINNQHRWFYYTEGTGKGLRHWWIEVLEIHREKHKYQWGRHFLPHDADADMQGEEVETPHQILTGLGMRNIKVVPRVSTLSKGLEVTRKALVGNHWFDRRTPDKDKGEDMGAGLGIKCLDGYQYLWDDKLGVWSREPAHNWASHGADAWRQHAQGWDNAALSQDPGFARFKQRTRRGL